MSKLTPKSVFDNKYDYLDNVYPKPGIKNLRNFDFLQERLLYGRIDDQANVIRNLGDSLKQVKSSRGTALAQNFVADAFAEMRMYFKRAINSDSISTESILTDPQVYTGYTAVGPLYHRHMDDIYRQFVLTYATPSSDIGNSIVDFRTFMKAFLVFCHRMAPRMPITKSGFISHQKCPPYVSGLVLEIANRDHNSQANKEAFVYDQNFNFYRTAAKKFGFWVDVNAPWRLVFNIKSYGEYPEIANIGEGIGQPTGYLLKSGALKYMEQYGITYDNIFQTCFIKAYREDLQILRSYLYAFYNSYSQTYPIAHRVTTISDLAQGCNSSKTVATPVPRFLYTMDDMKSAYSLPYEYLSEYDANFWLRIYLEIRSLETRVYFSRKELSEKVKTAWEYKRVFGLQKALSYVNMVTMGYEKSRFISRGKFYQGQSEEIYETRIERAGVQREAFVPTGQIQYGDVATNIAPGQGAPQTDLPSTMTTSPGSYGGGGSSGGSGGGGGGGY